MPQETDKFLQAEEAAEKLTETLKKLHSEATSYQTAKKELDTVRQRLLGLIESTEKVAADTQEIIKTLKAIGGPEILKKLDNLKILVLITLAVSLVAVIITFLR